MTTANTVFSGPADVVKPIYEEAPVKAAETILPGHLVLENASGEWINHNAASKGGDYRIANMNIIEQKSATTALTAGDDATAFVPRPGEVYNVVVADGETIAIGDPLVSNGDGTVKEGTTDGFDDILFYAREAVTTSGSTGRIRARVATATYNATA